MSALTITRHAASRMSQRGMMLNDAELIVQIGSQVDDGYLVTEKDYREVEHRLKQFLQDARRLVGKRLVVKNGQIVTAYRPSKTNERRLIRAARDSNQLE